MRFLLSDTVEWHVGTLPAAAIETLRVITERDFVARAPSHLLGEFARNTDSGTPPIDDFDVGYRSLRASFDLARSRGRPIVVAPSADGPYTIAEGLTRLTCLASLVRTGHPVPSKIEFLVGTTPRLTAWGWAP